MREKQEERLLGLFILTRFIMRIKKWSCDVPTDVCPLHYFMLDLHAKNWRARCCYIPLAGKSARIIKCTSS